MLSVDVYDTAIVRACNVCCC